ncbi:13294_t:CDS:2 [Acaulospora morrowiae]|uniref:13294_t:CDS:1 n=1 Tax=Acaulospora morrowiae TaxID=94023 RepID=A0A9N8WNR9_9GLOM|nr:13294_t:CDS:2 [Acaulospora morrowiae]
MESNTEDETQRTSMLHPHEERSSSKRFLKKFGFHKSKRVCCKNIWLTEDYEPTYLFWAILFSSSILLMAAFATTPVT